MRGKRQTLKRKINPDIKYNSVVIAKFVNHLMERGKKSVAQRIVYQAFDIIKEKTKKDPLDIFNLAMRNVGPDVELRTRRVGGANYQIPLYVSEDRKMTLAFRWIIQAVRSGKGRPTREKLAAELLGASENQGVAIKKKQDVYRMAQANRAFAHFAM